MKTTSVPFWKVIKTIVLFGTVFATAFVFVRTVSTIIEDLTGSVCIK